MTFAEGMYAALALSVVLLVLGIYLIFEGREVAPVQSVADDLVLDGEERRETHRHFLRMLLGLNSLEERYVRFTTRALIGFAIVGATTIVGLGTNAYLLHRLSSVASQNRQGVLTECQDIETLKGAIRATIDRLAQDPTASRAFAAKHCPRIQRPPR